MALLSCLQKNCPDRAVWSLKRPNNAHPAQNACFCRLNLTVLSRMDRTSRWSVHPGMQAVSSSQIQGTDMTQLTVILGPEDPGPPALPTDRVPWFYPIPATRALLAGPAARPAAQLLAGLPPDVGSLAAASPLLRAAMSPGACPASSGRLLCGSTREHGVLVDMVYPGTGARVHHAHRTHAHRAAA